MRLLLKKTLANPRARQAASLYISLLLSLVLGIAVSVINTRFLSPKEFGDFKLLQTVWTVGVMFVTFGLLTTGGNLLAKTQSKEEEKSLLGSLLVITAIISALFIVLMVAVSFPFGQLYGDEFGQQIRLYAGLLFVFPFQLFLQEALRGTNNIHSLSFLNAMPQIIYIPGAIAVHRWLEFSLDWSILLYLSSMALTVLVILYWTKPRITNLKQGISQTLSRNRSLGGHIYIASLVTTTTSYLSQFTLGYFQSTQQVGEFSLALTITMPLTMVPNAIATTFFKQFANIDSIPPKIIIAATGLSTITLLGFLFFIDKIIVLLYTDRFSNVISLSYICAIACVIHGIADIYNRFLLANDRTSWLKVNAIQLAVISLLGSTLLVMEYGIEGAVMTKLLVAMTYLLTMLIYYKRVRGLARH